MSALKKKIESVSFSQKCLELSRKLQKKNTKSWMINTYVKTFMASTLHCTHKYSKSLENEPFLVYQNHQISIYSI